MLWIMGVFSPVSCGPLLTHQKSGLVCPAVEGDIAMMVKRPWQQEWGPLSQSVVTAHRPLLSLPPLTQSSSLLFSAPQSTTCLPLLCSKSSMGTEDITVNSETVQSMGSSGLVTRAAQQSVVVHPDNLSSHSEAGGRRIRSLRSSSTTQ